MIVKDIVYEDFVNYKKPSMFILFPYCSFKCEKECGVQCCQNSPLATAPNIEVSIKDVVKKYNENLITEAVVCGGLEPLDSWEELLELITEIRKNSNDDIIIYTGYNRAEVENKISILMRYCNIIVKFGKYIPNQMLHFDDILGVNLASRNQYAERIS